MRTIRSPRWAAAVRDQDQCVSFLIAGVVQLALLDPHAKQSDGEPSRRDRPRPAAGPREQRSQTRIAQVGAPLGPLVAGLLLGAFSTRLACFVITAWFAAIALWATLGPSFRQAPDLTQLTEAE